MKVLIVDDETGIRQIIREYCLFENYNPLEASNGEEAINIVKNNDIDIIILDIMMPKMDGYTTLKEIRKISRVPVIMLSARSDECDKLLSFELGVDDYITKPFSPKELIARIKAVTNRKIENKNQECYKYKTLEIDYLGHKVMIDGQEIKLTPKEYELLCLFVKNKSIALSRETLLSKIWGYDFFGDDRTIDTHIKMLRNNLGEYRDLIKTIRAVGYKYEEK